MEEYSLQVLGVILRLLGWYVLLFGVLGPLILPNIPGYRLVNRLMYSWVGVGGFILISTILLVQLQLYDFISIALLLIVLPFSIKVNSYKKQGYSYGKAFSLIYDLLLLKQIRFIERLSRRYIKKWIKNKTHSIKSLKSPNRTSFDESFLVPFIALAGAFIRFYPAFINASPFTRGWYDSLNRVKELSLQHYFDISVDPGGLHVLVNFFSKLTQIGPELILHLLGGLTGMLISVWIYGILRDMIYEKRSLAPLIGMALYALAPVIIVPISLESQVEPNTIDLALTFALPVMMVWVRNLKKGIKMSGMFVVGGMVATGLTNLFVLLMILLPGLILSGLIVKGDVKYIIRLREIGKVLGVNVLIFSAYWIIVSVNTDLDFKTYVLEQLYSSQFYRYFPSLWLPLERMTLIYAATTFLVAMLTLINRFLHQRTYEVHYLFYLIFLMVSILYLPELELGYTYVDLDQLSAFYAVLIAVLGGLLFNNIFSLLSVIFESSWKWRRYIEVTLTVMGFGGILFLQGGIKTSNILPQTLPNGFFYSYYQIIEENLPYTYATVGPEIDSTLAKNRHFFMDYGYFLNNYSSIDSLYHEQLAANERKQDITNVPPASIFVFVAQPPYSSIQSGILYNPSRIMEALRQWLDEYDQMDKRKVRVYKNYENATIYELVNREGEVRIDDILDHTYPDTLNTMR